MNVPVRAAALHLLLIAVAIALASTTASAQAGARPLPVPGWPAWGGPAGNFQIAQPGLRWTGAQPRARWRRDLGDGYSMVVGDGQVVYAMARQDARAIAVSALDAATGATRWTRDIEEPTRSGMFLAYGTGPNSTPLLAAGRLYLVTHHGRVCALEAASGRTLWTRELWQELNGTFRDVGYSASPLLVDGRIVLPVGGKGQGLVAFDADTGATAWKAGDYGNAMASPILIEVGGERQIAAFMVEGVAGFDAATGVERWFHPHKTSYDVNAATPAWHAPSQTLVISSAYDHGARGIRLTRQGGRTTATEAWFNRRLRVHHGTMLVLGNHVYASSGDFGPAPMTAIDVTTGQVAWQSRHFPKVNMVHLGDRTLVLDEDGRLAFVTLAPGGLTVHQEASVLTRLAWTAPTVIGQRLYVRDRKTLVALDLDRT